MSAVAIIDAHNHIHRLHYVLHADLGTSALVEQFGRLIGILLDRFRLDLMVVAFDPERDASPKPGRVDTPERVLEAKPLIVSLVESMGIRAIVPPSSPHLSYPPPHRAVQDEGDQLVADLAGHYAQAGNEVFIVSSDKDFAQLVGTNISLLRREGMDWAVYDAEKVETKWGVPPAQMAHYLTLVGDSVDGIPGTPGIGPKTAGKLLKHYHTVEDLVLATSGHALTEGVKLQCYPNNILSPKLAAALSEDTPNLWTRLQQVSLVPRPCILSPDPPATRPIAVAKVGLTQMAATIMSKGSLFKAAV